MHVAFTRHCRLFDNQSYYRKICILQRPGGIQLDYLHTIRAQALRQAMLEAQEALQKAQADHQSAMEVMMDADGALALRQKGRAYAEALTAYADATMAWLAFVDLGLSTVSKVPHRRLAAGS